MEHLLSLGILWKRKEDHSRSFRLVKPLVAWLYHNQACTRLCFLRAIIPVMPAACDRSQVCSTVTKTLAGT